MVFTIPHNIIIKLKHIIKYTYLSVRYNGILLHWYISQFHIVYHMNILISIAFFINRIQYSCLYPSVIYCRIIIIIQSMYTINRAYQIYKYIIFGSMHVYSIGFARYNIVCIILFLSILSTVFWFYKLYIIFKNVIKLFLSGTFKIAIIDA
jgi:hypothetical protein